jgi:hypothetical protein
MCCLAEMVGKRFAHLRFCLGAILVLGVCVEGLRGDTLGLAVYPPHAVVTGVKLKYVFDSASSTGTLTATQNGMTAVSLLNHGGTEAMYSPFSPSDPHSISFSFSALLDEFGELKGDASVRLSVTPLSPAGPEQVLFFSDKVLAVGSTFGGGSGTMIEFLFKHEPMSGLEHPYPFIGLKFSTFSTPPNGFAASFESSAKADVFATPTPDGLTGGMVLAGIVGMTVIFKRQRHLESPVRA